MKQDNYYVEGQSHLEQISENGTGNKSGNLGGILTFMPDARHTLRITSSFSTSQALQSTSVIFSTLQEDSGLIKMSQGNSLNFMNNKRSNIGSQVYFEQLSSRAKKRFTIALNVQYTKSRNTTDAKNVCDSECKQSIQ